MVDAPQSSQENTGEESPAPDALQEPEAESTKPSAAAKITEMAKNLAGSMIGGDKKKWTKVAIISALVIIFMALASTMAWGLAIWALVNSIAEPSGVAYGSGSGELTFPLSAATPESIACLDNWLQNKKPDSPLNGKAAAFVASGQTYNVNPALILGIAGAESTFGTNWRLIDKETLNYQSMKCDTGQRTTPGTECIGDWAKYPTWEKSIDEHNKYLRQTYLNQGINTISAIGKIYCGSNCSDWEPTVTSVFNEIISACPGFSSSTNSSIMHGDLIVIDPGHGSGDNSFVATVDSANNEGDHNWLIANKVKKNLEVAGFNVLLTKNSVTENPTLSQRSQFANQRGAAVYISLHSNASGGPGSMSIIYCSGIAGDGSPNYKPDSCAADANAKHGRDIGHAILSNIKTNFGLAPQDFWGGELGTLTGLQMPGVLIEMFAHDEMGDIQKVNGKSDLMAKSISDGILSIMKKN